MKNIIRVILFLLLVSLSFSADATITIQTSTNNVSIGESFAISVTSQGNLNGNDIVINGIENFEVIGKSSSSSMQIINGKYSSETSIQLNLMPKRSGKFILSGSLNGKKSSSNSIVIDVSESTQGNSGSSEIISDGKLMFLNSSEMPDKLYFGEKKPLIIDFYSKYQLAQASFLEMPVYNGFVISELEKEQAHYQIMNNERYGKYNLKKDVIQPVKTGNIKIKPYTFRVNYIDDYGSMGTKDFNTKSFSVNVVPLPEPVPEGFKNIVGNIEVEANTADKKINFGESITLIVKIYGEGNLDSVEKIYQENYEGVKIYQTLKEKKEEIQGGKYYAEKEFEVIFIPEKSGKIKIPELKLNFLNCKTGKYEEVIINSFIINVSGNIKGVNKIIPLNKKERQLLNSADKISIIEEEDKRIINKNSLKYIISFILIICIILFIIVILKKILPKVIKKKGMEELLISVYGVDLKTDSKEEIKRKIDNSEILEKLVFVIEETEKEKMGFEADKIKVIKYKDRIREILRKSKKIR